jgi:hypothetical protein
MKETKVLLTFTSQFKASSILDSAHSFKNTREGKNSGKTMLTKTSTVAPQSLGKSKVGSK